MQRSTERFLTTHTGSLPRPDDLIRMMYAKEEGVPVDRPALEARIRSAVAEIVSRQCNAGVDLVNDGELSKPSYATYVKDRLNGFGGTGNTRTAGNNQGINTPCRYCYIVYLRILIGRAKTIWSTPTIK